MFTKKKHTIEGADRHHEHSSRVRAVFTTWCGCTEDGVITEVLGIRSPQPLFIWEEERIAFLVKERFLSRLSDERGRLVSGREGHPITVWANWEADGSFDRDIR